MVHSPLTRHVYNTPQKGSRLGATVDHGLIHHFAGTDYDGVVRSMVTGSRVVSANYTIDRFGNIDCIVPEEMRAWTSGSSRDGGRGAAWDRRSINIEMANSSGAPNWSISDATIDAAARLFLDWERRNGRRLTLIGHRELSEKHSASYPTYCPGPNTVARIRARMDYLRNEDELNDNDRRWLEERFNALNDRVNSIYTDSPMFHQFQQHADLSSKGWTPATRADGRPIVADTKAYLRGAYWYIQTILVKLFGDPQKNGMTNQGGPGGIIDEMNNRIAALEKPRDE